MSEVVARVIELFESTCCKQFESMHCEIHPLNKVDATTSRQLYLFFDKLFF